jgi:hypothetical protein
MTLLGQQIDLEFSLIGGGILPSLMAISIPPRLIATMGFIESLALPIKSVVEMRPVSLMEAEGVAGTNFAGFLAMMK